MQIMPGVANRLAAVAVALTLGACSSGSALTTSSLFGGKEKSDLPAPRAETMTDRVAQAGTTAARAQRCGYVFDPVALRQSYLTYETQQGATPEVVASAEKSYDFTYAKVMKQISGDPEYCSDEQTSIIKRDLTKILAGDFSTVSRQPQANVGWWTPEHATKPMNRDEIFNPVR